MTYDARHGGPFDRGGADFWYGRGFNPHYYKEDAFDVYASSVRHAMACAGLEGV